MQSTNQPAKFLIPFAQNDSAKVELPATSSDPTRFSQSLGSPPLTGMPPEAGGVPPQLEDFNGAMNQIARGVWWALGGGRFAYDATWATDSLIGGYARGSVLPAALGTGMVGMGEWYNNTEANTADPDANGTGWVPGYHYGSTALTGQTGGTVTLSPAQAAKRVITVAGTLTSNLVLVLPTWIYSWRIVNNTGGAFTVTAKNAATAAVTIPQNGAPTIVNCDGTQVSLDSPNIAPAVLSTQPMQLGQATGRLLRTTAYWLAGGVQYVSVDGNTPSTTGAGTFTALAATRQMRVRCLGGGGAGGGTTAQNASSFGAAGGGASGAFAESLLAAAAVAFPIAITAGAGGTGVAGGTGGAGGTSSFGTLVTAAGGGGGSFAGAVSGSQVAAGGAGGTGNGNIYQGQGAPGLPGLSFGNTLFVTGAGGNSLMGGGGNPRASAAGAGIASNAYGGGGSGAGGQNNSGPQPGGGGGAGIVIIEEYS